MFSWLTLQEIQFILESGSLNFDEPIINWWEIDTNIQGVENWKNNNVDSYIEFLKKLEHPAVRVDLELTQPKLQEVHNNILRKVHEIFTGSDEVKKQNLMNRLERALDQRQKLIGNTKIKIYSSLTHSTNFRVDIGYPKKDLFFVGEVEISQLEKDKQRLYTKNLTKSYINTEAPVFVETKVEFLKERNFNEEIEKIKNNPEITKGRKKIEIQKIKDTAERLQISQEMLSNNPNKGDVSKEMKKTLLRNTNDHLKNSMDSFNKSFSSEKSFEDQIQKFASSPQLEYDDVNNNSPTIQSPDDFKLNQNSSKNNSNRSKSMSPKSSVTTNSIKSVCRISKFIL